MRIAPLLLAAARAADVLVSTALFEQLDYMEKTLANLVGFTEPRTPIVVHVGAKVAQKHYESLVRRHASDRVHFNPRRIWTHHATGTILEAHVSNAERAREIALPFDYVVFSASKARLFVRGLEAYVVANEMTRLKDIAGGLHC